MTNVNYTDSKLYSFRYPFCKTLPTSIIEMIIYGKLLFNWFTIIIYYIVYLFALKQYHWKSYKHYHFELSLSHTLYHSLDIQLT